MELTDAVETLTDMLFDDPSGDLEQLLDNLAELHEQDDHEEIADLTGIGDPDIAALLLDSDLSVEALLALACAPVLHMLRRSGLETSQLQDDLGHLSDSLTGAPLDLLIELADSLGDADVLGAWTACWDNLDDALATADRLSLAQTLYANIEQLADELRELVDDVSAQVDTPAEPLERLLA